MSFASPPSAPSASRAAIVGPFEAWVVFAAVHGLEHVEQASGLPRVVVAVTRLIAALDACSPLARGTVPDGAWGIFSARDFPVHAALSLAGLPSAVGAARGWVDLGEGAPQGAPARQAWRQAWSVRMGEVLVPAAGLVGTELPQGVGSFQAPPPLDHGPEACVIIRDYRPVEG